MLVKKIKKLIAQLKSRNLNFEASVCENLLKKIAKNPVEIDEYNGINQPMSPLAAMDDECDHNFDADECPACGKKLLQ